MCSCTSDSARSRRREASWRVLPAKCPLLWSPSTRQAGTIFEVSSLEGSIWPGRGPSCRSTAVRELVGQGPSLACVSAFSNVALRQNSPASSPVAIALVSSACSRETSSNVHDLVEQYECIHQSRMGLKPHITHMHHKPKTFCRCRLCRRA